MKILNGLIAISILLSISCSKKVYLTQINSLNIELELCKKRDKRIFSASNARYSHALFLSIENTLSISHNYNKDSLTYEVDNGTITTKDNGNLLSIIPVKEGELWLKVFNFESGKKVQIIAQSFRVMKIPDPIIKFDSKTKFEISKEDLLQVKNFTCNQTHHFEYLIPYEILKFTGKILRGDKVVLTWQQNGSIIDNQTRQLFGQLESGDYIIVENCEVKREGQTEFEKLKTMIYKIK